ncbi:hypothetical protein BKA80DRAFT_121482 [Phyllosticta citrichinensis]
MSTPSLYIPTIRFRPCPPLRKAFAASIPNFIIQRPHGYLATQTTTATHTASLLRPSDLESIARALLLVSCDRLVPVGLSRLQKYEQNGIVWQHRCLFFSSAPLVLNDSALSSNSNFFSAFALRCYVEYWRRPGLHIDSGVPRAVHFGPQSLLSCATPQRKQTCPRMQNTNQKLENNKKSTKVRKRSTKKKKKKKKARGGRESAPQGQRQTERAGRVSCRKAKNMEYGDDGMGMSCPLPPEFPSKLVLFGRRCQV